MSITHTITKVWQGQSGPMITHSSVLTGSEELNFDFALAGDTTNQQQNLAFTKALLQSIYIYSDQSITIKTNSSGTPQDTLNIDGGDAYLWDINCGLPNPFAGNVTAAFFTNSGATAANVSIRTLTNG